MTRSLCLGESSRRRLPFDFRHHAARCILQPQMGLDELEPYEAKLREVVVARLRSQFASDVQATAIPTGMLRQWESWGKKRGARPNETWPQLIRFASLGDLFSLIEKHWQSLADLVGGDRARFNVLSRAIKDARDDLRHAREVPEGDLALAEGALAWFVAQLRSVYPAERLLLDRQVEQYRDARYGFTASLDMVNLFWACRADLDFTDEDLAFLIDSAETNSPGASQQWLDVYGLREDALFFICRAKYRRAWELLVGENRGSNIDLAAPVAAFRWFLLHEDEQRGAATILSFISRLPDALNFQPGRPRRAAKLVAQKLIEQVIQLLIRELLVGCCSGLESCTRVHGYEERRSMNARSKNARSGDFLVVENMTEKCHVALVTRNGTRRRRNACRLHEIEALLGEDGVARLSRLSRVLTTVGAVARALSQRDGNHAEGRWQWVVERSSTKESIEAAERSTVASDEEEVVLADPISPSCR